MSTVPDLAPDAPPLPNSKPAFLKRVRIRGYKSIAFCDVTLEPLTILVGRNASGKSNFLDALGFLRDSVARGIVEAVRLHHGRKSILARSSREDTVSLSIHANYDNPITGVPYTAEYTLELDLPERSKPTIATEKIRIIDQVTTTTMGFNRLGKHVEWIGFSKGNDPLLDWCPADRPLLGMYGNPPFFELSVALHQFGVYNFSPADIRELQTPTPGVFLEKTGRNIASILASIEEQQPTMVRRIGAYLSAIAPEVVGFQVARYGEYETIKFQVHSATTPKPNEFDAVSMSDGTLRVLAALVASSQIQLWGEHNLVAIEEPETSLHPAAMNALVDALDEATLRTQILLTTHSAEMLDNPTIRPENIRVVEMIDGQTVIAPVDEASVEIVRRKLDTLGGLERQNQLQADLNDLDRQRHLSQNGQGPKG